MDRVAVFVDAGYLFAQGSTALAGRKLQRGEMEFLPQEAVKTIATLAEELAELPLLRIYWYDGTAGNPSSTHLALAELARLKLRLGIVNSVGEQKGVDSLIITDMISLARNRGMAAAVLLSGDEDLRVGVQQAQEFGVVVHLVGIEPSRGSQSLLLIQEADSITELSAQDISPFLRLRPTPTSDDQTYEMPDDQADLMTVLKTTAESVARGIPSANLAILLETLAANGPVPSEFDRHLLGTCLHRLGRPLNPQEKRILRDEFRVCCRALMA